jgi:uncharacterized RDD family membrane protein YckC
MADEPPILAGDSGGAPTAVCAECGNTFAQGDMIAHGSHFICANCKPVFMQKLAEGANITGNRPPMRYAGFWIRFAAIFLDGILLQILRVLFGLVFGLSMAEILSGRSNATSAPMPIYFVMTLVMSILNIAYEVYFIGRWGATLGKMACKIKVVRSDGERVTYLRSLARYFAKILSAVIFCIGYIMAAFDSEKRALHDRICDTRVVHTT